MTLSLIVAVDHARRIAVGGQLPWKLPEDMRRFRRLTLGHVVIMGRKTFQSIGHPLEHRANVVLTRERKKGGHTGDGNLRYAASFDIAWQLRDRRPDKETFVIGGAEVYREAFPRCERIYLTRVDDFGPTEGATLFPWDAMTGLWKETDASPWHPPDDRHSHGYQFSTLERVTP